MNLEFDKVNIFYHDIFLAKVDLRKKYDLEKIKQQLNAHLPSDYTLSIGDVNKLNEIDYNIKSSYLINKLFCNEKIKDYLDETSFNIITYLEVLDGLVLNDFIDNFIDINNFPIPISYAGIIAERNLEICKQLFKNLKENNQLLCNFLLRDLIENIKLYLYLLKGDKKEITTKIDCTTYTQIYNDKEVKEHINKSLLGMTNDWNFNIKDIISNNPTLMLWKTELEKINKLNTQCNSYIHKNGLTKILPNMINNSKSKIDIDMVCFCIKFFLTLVVCYDEKAISSTDYYDYLDMGEEPPRDSQYWVAPIFKMFINNEFTNEEIEKLKSMTVMDIEIK